MFLANVLNVFVMCFLALVVVEGSLSRFGDPPVRTKLCESRNCLMAMASCDMNTLQIRMAAIHSSWNIGTSNKPVNQLGLA